MGDALLDQLVDLLLTLGEIGVCEQGEQSVEREAGLLGIDVLIR